MTAPHVDGDIIDGPSNRVHGHLDLDSPHLDREGRTAHEALPLEKRSEDPQPVAATLELAPVRVEHAQAKYIDIGVREQHHDPVRADAPGPVAHGFHCGGSRRPSRPLAED